MKKRENRSSTPTVLLDHLKELQFRFLMCAFIMVAAGVVAYFYYQPIFTILTAPLHQKLFYSTPAGSFTFVMRICFVAGIAVSVPVIIYHLAMFLRPAFQKVFSFTHILVVTGSSVVLAAAGAAFGYFFIIPGALRFFSGFQAKGLGALISADSYLSFVIGVLLTFVLIFQLPLLMSLFDRIKPLRLKPLLAAEKWIILASLLIALIVPFAFDLTTCLLIAAPIVVFYNLSIVIILIQHGIARSRSKKSQPVVTQQPDVIEEFTERFARETPVDPPLPAEPVAAAKNPVPRKTNGVAFDFVTAPKSHQVVLATRPIITPKRPPAPLEVPGRLISDFRPSTN